MGNDAAITGADAVILPEMALPGRDIERRVGSRRARLLPKLGERPRERYARSGRRFQCPVACSKAKASWSTPQSS
jgi:hypothetical protein